MTARLTISGIAKRFGPTVALDGVDWQLNAGEIHAVLGENGAGKSTMMKILTGAVRPDSGQMMLDGRPYAPIGPQHARREGVAMVYQELSLCPHLTVEANILLGQEISRVGYLNRAEQKRLARDLLGQLEHTEIDPDAAVHSLSPAQRQLVEIARALLTDVRILILDEPTSALTAADTQRLFTLIRRLRDRGVTVVYISHFLEEIEEVADRFTVLRDGRNVAGDLRSAYSRDRVIEWMVGRPVVEQFPKVPHSTGEPILEIDKLAGMDLPRGVSLTLHRGEILGIAGIVGSGRTELARSLFGLDQVRSGRVTLRQYSGPATPRRRLDQGMGLVSEDRAGEGLALGQSIADNLTLSRMTPYSRWGTLNLRQRASAVADWLRRLNIRARGGDQPVGDLSGGNQQKVAIGRLLHQEADVLLLDEPTKGIDVASKAEIYRLMGEQAANGKSILFISSYLPELFGVCDRLAVMARGRLSEVRPISQWSPEAVMAFATGASTTIQR